MQILVKYNLPCEHKFKNLKTSTVENQNRFHYMKACMTTFILHIAVWFVIFYYIKNN